MITSNAVIDKLRRILKTKGLSFSDLCPGDSVNSVEFVNLMKKSGLSAKEAVKLLELTENDTATG